MRKKFNTDDLFFLVWTLLTLLGMWTDNIPLLLGIIIFQLLLIKNSVSKSG